MMGVKPSCLTRISESFDDSKHVADLCVDQDVVHLHSDVLAASQSVWRHVEAPNKTTAGVRLWSMDVPVHSKKKKKKLRLSSD